MSGSLFATLVTVLALYGATVLLFLWLTRGQRKSTRRSK